MAKLHCFVWSKWEHVLVNVVPRIVHNPTRPAISLWDYSRGTEAKIAEFFGKAEGDDNPLSFFYHVNKFHLKKINVVKA